MTHVSPQAIRLFRRRVYEHYRAHRRDFPWRRTHDPYRILVSEIMLQQTRAGHVVAFYIRFIKRFPTVASLARARSGDVIKVWQGLGYNRRALNLHRAAQRIVTAHGGKVPADITELYSFPGVGKYTAAAVLAFAFNEPVVFVETNIRTVYLHSFLKNKKKVSDKMILPLVEQTVDRKNPREWYQALMDYGAMLKNKVGNENVRSRHYAKQSRFEGSLRQVRGKLLFLAATSTITPRGLSVFCKKHRVSISVARKVLGALVSEGFLRPKGVSFVLR